MGETFTDRVCGRELSADDVKAKRVFLGHRLQFCSEECAAAFDEQPGLYIGIDPGLKCPES
jgi:YHS domain-containing protein